MAITSGLTGHSSVNIGILWRRHWRLRFKDGIQSSLKAAISVIELGAASELILKAQIRAPGMRKIRHGRSPSLQAFRLA
jgi:hypothetical protein